MSAADNELSLVQMIVESDDQTFISKMTAYALSLKKQKAVDRADDLPADVLEDILLGIEELDNGDPGVSHEVVLEKYRNKYPRNNSVKIK